MAGALVMGAAALLAAQPRKVLKPVPVRARRSRDRLR